MKFGPRSWLVGALALLPPLAAEALLGHGPHKGFDVFGFGACLLMVLAALFFYADVVVRWIGTIG